MLCCAIIYSVCMHYTIWFSGKQPLFAEEYRIVDENIFVFSLYKGLKACYNVQAIRQMHRWLNG